MSNLTVDPTAALPLYAQCEALLRRLIRQRQYREGDLLPDELTLANQFGVSRGTVREALKRLVAEGLIERRAGAGTRVVAAPMRTSLEAWPSFTREMAQLGIEVQTLNWSIQSIAADASVAQALQITPGCRVRFLSRLRSADGEPAVQFHSWFHPRLGDLKQLDSQRPLYEAIEALTGIAPGRSRETIRAGRADQAVAQRLRTDEGAPVLLRQRTVYDMIGRPFEYALVTYRADRFSYSITLDRGPR